jgi:predicted metal-dependent hydrolase
VPVSIADIDYRVRVSPRAKHLRLTVQNDGRVVVTVPRGFSLTKAWEFVAEKEDWIQKKRQLIQNHKPKFNYPIGSKAYQQYKKSALELVRHRIAQYNIFYRFQYRSISIRNQKTRWGSCSSRGNLQFNYQIVFLPIHLADYLIVHELCHLGAMNHSLKFWQLVEKSIPDYKLRRKELRTLGLQPG